jgi:mannose-6-phosphate isomerase-like protein (cupin superfamily)
MKRYEANYLKDVKQIEQPEQRPKKWGNERILVNKDYASKAMTLYPNMQVSLHFHAEKSESFILLEGQLIVETVNLATGEKTRTLLQNKLDCISIEKMVPHTFYCPEGQEENTVFIEVSTTDYINDSFRLTQSGDIRRSPN